MASSTTNLDLTLPVGGENVSRQIINANNVKIDEAVGAVPSGTDLQSQVTALNNKSFSQPANDTNFNNITVAGAYCFSWIASGTTYNRPVNQGGLLVVSIGYNAEVKSQQYTDTNGKVHARGYHDGAWTSWKELAQNDKISNVSYTTYANFFESNSVGFSSGVVLANAADTPFSSGSTDAIQFKYSDSYGVQFSMRPAEDRIFYRRIASGTWSGWSEIYSSTPNVVTISATVQNIAIPAGTPSSPQTVTIDLSSYRPSSSHNLMNVLICMQDNNAGNYYNLPNFTHDATKYTVVSVVGTTNIKIENTQASWGTTKACITMFWQK